MIYPLKVLYVLSPILGALMTNGRYSYWPPSIILHWIRDV